MDILENDVGHVLPRGLDDLALPGRRTQDGRRGQRGGVHTFTHVDLSYQSEARVKRRSRRRSSPWRAPRIPRPVRAPTPRRPTRSTTTAQPVYERLGAMGYTSVFIDTDSEDWQQPGVDKIVEWATPEDGARQGALPRRRRRPLPDADRAAEVHREDEGAGLHLHHGERRSAAGLRDPRGGRDRASRNGSGRRPRAARRRAGQRGTGRPPEGEHGVEWEGRALLAAVAVAEWTGGLAVVLGVVGVAVLKPLRHDAAARPAPLPAAQQTPTEFTWGPEVTEPVSVIVPAYNEKECIAQYAQLPCPPATHPDPIEIGGRRRRLDRRRGGDSRGAGAAQCPGDPAGENAGKSAALSNGVRQARQRRGRSVRARVTELSEELWTTISTPTPRARS